MVAVATGRSEMRRSKRGKKVSILESIVELFRHEATRVGAENPQAGRRTTKLGALKRAVTVTPPSKSREKSCDMERTAYPAKRLLGFSTAGRLTAAMPTTTPQMKATTPPRRVMAARTSPIKKNGVVVKQLMAHKKATLSAKQPLGFGAPSSSLFQLKSLAASLATTARKFFPSSTKQKQNPAHITTEHSEAMAVSHALQDELDSYLKQHTEIARTDRLELIHWAKTVRSKLHVCDRQIMEQIHVGDEMKLELEKKKTRDEIEELKRQCMDAEIHANASRFVVQDGRDGLTSQVDCE